MRTRHVTCDSVMCTDISAKAAVVIESKARQSLKILSALKEVFSWQTSHDFTALRAYPDPYSPTYLVDLIIWKTHPRSKLVIFVTVIIVHYRPISCL